MKVVFSILIVLLPFLAQGQYSYESDKTNSTPLSSANPNSQLLQDDYEIGKFALSLSPTGFIQFGPIVNAEFGVSKNFVINTHLRFTKLGLLSHVVRAHSDGLDKLKGIAFGAGGFYFFGERRNKPYAGFAIEYDKSDALYAENEQWEWSEVNKSAVLIFSGGYRFRFTSGFFINTGAYLGASIVKYDWEYTDTSYGNGGDGNEVNPFGMLDVTFGIEF